MLEGASSPTCTFTGKQLEGWAPGHVAGRGRSQEAAGSRRSVLFAETKLVLCL